jgi:hypothetical protein
MNKSIIYIQLLSTLASHQTNTISKTIILRSYYNYVINELEKKLLLEYDEYAMTIYSTQIAEVTQLKEVNELMLKQAEMFLEITKYKINTETENMNFIRSRSYTNQRPNRCEKGRVSKYAKQNKRIQHQTVPAQYIQDSNISNPELK